MGFLARIKQRTIRDQQFSHHSPTPLGIVVEPNKIYTEFTRCVKGKIETIPATAEFCKELEDRVEEELGDRLLTFMEVASLDTPKKTVPPNKPEPDKEPEPDKKPDTVITGAKKKKATKKNK